MEDSKANSANASAYTAQSSRTAEDEQWAHLPALQRSIVKFIRDQPPHDDGVHVAAIARAVGGEATKIRYVWSSWTSRTSGLCVSSDALDRLMDDGHVYTTIDESHFNLSI